MRKKSDAQNDHVICERNWENEKDRKSEIKMIESEEEKEKKWEREGGRKEGQEDREDSGEFGWALQLSTWRTETDFPFFVFD